MDEIMFNEKYAFNNFKIVDVANPTANDYAFQITMQVGVDPGTGKLLTEARHYLVRAGSHERFPGVVANKYLDGMSKLLAQDEDKFKLFADYGTRSEYYERLIIDVEDLVAQPMVELPAAQGGSKTAVEAGDGEETPFSGVAKEPARLGRPPKQA